MNQNAEKRKNIESIYTLSPIQQGMLFHTVYAPNSGVYVEQKLFTICGQVNVVNFKQAWQKVIERHSVLRTLFVWEKQEKPLQVVLKQIDLPWHDCDWQNIPASEQHQRLEELLQKDRYQGFTLNQAPLMRFTLIKLGEDRYQFLWSHHHISMDGWCLPIIVKEVLTFYEAYNLGKTPFLSSPRPYQDYIAWLQRQDISQAEAFWQRNLQGLKTPTPLVVDKLAVQDSQEYPTYPKYELSLSSKVTQALQTIAKQQSITLATLVQAAWAVLLSRYSGEREVLFGVTVSGRSGDLAGIEEMVGLFINTLPLRVEVTRDKSVLEFLQTVQKKSVELQEYTYISLAEVQRLSDVPATIPLFESIVVFENYPVDKSLQESKYSFDVTGVEAFEQTNYPLAVLVFAKEELSIKISYDASRFAEATIARLAGHFQTLLEAIATNPDQTVAELPLLTQVERHQLLVEWNQTTRDYPPDKCLHQLFEEQVEKTPDAIAVEFDNQQLTYHKLNERANQLAHYLQSLGVEPEVLVGVAIERSLEMAIAVLAILKAGGAYVPIDPAYPQERRDFMLADTNCRVLISQSSLRSLFPKVDHLVLLDEQWEIIAQQPITNPSSPVQPNNLLYVIYTSGSTGRPKGITLSHQALGNLIYWHLETMNQGVGVLQFASLSFDASFHEMFAAWCSGGTLYMIPESLRLDVEKLVYFLTEKPIQKVILPVALWQQIAQIYGQQAELFHHLTEVVTTGEQLQITQPIIDLHKQLNHCRLHNHYGPSETHVVTYYIFNDLPDIWPVYPPIGKPIANTQIYILDQYGQPVPIGVPGFLLIGGANLARGYLHRPDLTAQKFVNNPFGQGLLYQTGDQARYLPDGNIEFIGRVDDQVKLRGFRVELGEVEAVLNKHPKISQAVVTVQGTAADEKRLVGYVVTKQSETITTEDLRHFLLQMLPEYMIPSVFVTLESLPLTPNQKVDRRALPLPDLQLNQNDYVAPRHPTEEIIANIFATVLKLEQVGIYDNFFTLGGHSLLATQAISRLRSSFQVDVPLRTLFSAPTVAELAQAILAMNQTNSALVVTPIESVLHETELLPLSWVQERLWFLDQLEGPNALYNMPIALQISGNLNIAALEQALTEIIQRHSILRTNFTTVNGNPVQAIAPPTDVKIPIVEVQANQIQQEAVQAAKQPFDLASDSLIRSQLLQLAENNYILLVTIHHIVFDAWSMSIFVRELLTLYEAALHQKSGVLPSLPIQYADFAYWQRQWLQGEVLETQLSYWKQQLNGTLPVLQLPIDYSHSPKQNYQGARQSLRLSKSLTTAIKSLSRQEGATTFMTLLAAFKLLLSRHTGQEDIIIGVPIAGRNHQGTEELIGCFLNTLPLRTDLSGNPSFRELLTKVREVTLSAYSHQDIPFEKLVEELKPERSLSRHPVFDVMFNMINTPTANLEIPGLTFEPLNHFTQPESKFFLTLFVQEVAEELNINIVYRQNLFSPEHMSNLLEQFEYLLQQITTQPDRPIQSYSLVTPQSRSLLPDPSLSLDQPDYEPVTTLFLNWAKQAPQQPAIRQDGQMWTYQELSHSAQNIAEVLLSCGVQPKDVVAVCGTRSFGLIASMVGVFLSGAVLLLLDPNQPIARSHLMI
ncbi:MAG TPA: amino acid adenylation domain-containing protein, partial [Nostocaceae cyanobacterium]|nr:amino acid adenylation domain-containing protein [Nostocaceae cyanobacterium]